MLATFVIGLREGLEAALIVGIIAAFLKQSNRADALRKVWIGVGSRRRCCAWPSGSRCRCSAPRCRSAQQEMLECVVAGHRRGDGQLHGAVDARAFPRPAQRTCRARPAARWPAARPVRWSSMAFLAVIREGFETAVFLLAAFQSALSPLQAAIGVVLGVAVAVVLGYLVYRGGVKLNLSRFFRITGVVLVLVAAGLVMSTLRAAYEAGWLTIGQQTLLDLSAIARPGSVQESLLTGMLGIRSSLPVVEVVAYVLYAVPMLLVVLWPPRRTPSTRTIGKILVGSAGRRAGGGRPAGRPRPRVAGSAHRRQGPFAPPRPGGSATGTDSDRAGGRRRRRPC